MMLGPCSGGAVRFAPAEAGLAIAEGIETGLSVQQHHHFPCWAALSAPMLESLQLPDPPLAQEVLIAADHDDSGRGKQAAERAAERWLFEGRNVRIALPPDPGTDFNDMLMSQI
jgi:phage/plasmid primase-like uncharacterized protein